MSEEMHQNIHSVYYTTEIVTALVHALRNEGKLAQNEVLDCEKIKDLVLTFVEDIEHEIDLIVRTKNDPTKSESKKRKANRRRMGEDSTQ